VPSVAVYVVQAVVIVVAMLATAPRGGWLSTPIVFKKRAAPPKPTT
jgi:hypothetical protein